MLPGCPRAGDCPYPRLPGYERVGVYFVAAAVILGLAVLNVLGVERDENLANARFVLTGAVCVPIVAFLVCLYRGWKDTSSHHDQLIFNALGLPGTMVALLFAFAK